MCLFCPTFFKALARESITTKREAENIDCKGHRAISRTNYFLPTNIQGRRAIPMPLPRLESCLSNKEEGSKGHRTSLDVGHPWGVMTSEVGHIRTRCGGSECTPLDPTGGGLYRRKSVAVHNEVRLLGSRRSSARTSFRTNHPHFQEANTATNPMHNQQAT